MKMPDSKHEHELTSDAVAVFEQMLDEIDDANVKKSITADETIVITSEKNQEWASLQGFSSMQMNTISFGLNSLSDIDPLESNKIA